MTHLMKTKKKPVKGKEELFSVKSTQLWNHVQKKKELGSTPSSKRASDGAVEWYSIGINTVTVP